MSSQNARTTALDGILVVDMTQALAGPYLGMLLGDLGADVVKVERPGVGDQSRGWGPPFAGNESSYFMAVNRNKRSLTCDFKTEGGLQVLMRLTDRAHVVLTNERRIASLRNMGMDYESLSLRNPGVVHCSITGFGMTGPYAGRAGYDIIAQGMSGLMSLTGDPGGPPMRHPASIADMATGMYGLGSVLAALFVRERTGVGQFLDLSLLESQAWWATIHAAAHFQTHQAPAKLGNDHPSIVPYGTFKAGDGYLIIGCGSERLWHSLCNVLDMNDMRDDPRYRTNRERVEHREQVRELLEEHLAARSVAEWCQLLEEARVPAGPIYSVPDMLNDPHMRARGCVVSQQHPTAGALHTLASPLRLSETPANCRLAPPLLGQHTDKVLAELGYGAAEAALLHASGAV